MNDELVFDLNLEDFISCGWDYELSMLLVYSYADINRVSKELLEKFMGDKSKERMIILLSKLCFMEMDVSSINAPFKPMYIDHQKNKRTSLPDDFTLEEFDFFELIIDKVNDHWFKSRLSDVLWLCLKPKNIKYAKIAIESYIKTPIQPDTWVKGNDKCWERSARICLQIKDLNNLNIIEDKIYSELMEVHKSHKLMSLWLAKLMDKLKIGRTKNHDIREEMFSKGVNLKKDHDYISAREYFQYAADKYKKEGENSKWVKCLSLNAECFELEGDSRNSESCMISNSLYETAIQAYRRIPTKFRNENNIVKKMFDLRHKLTNSGKLSLNEMSLMKSPGIDVTEITESSIRHVSNIHPIEKCLLFFSGISPISNYEKIEGDAKNQLATFSIRSFIGSTQIAEDGRVVGKTPPLILNPDKSTYKAVLSKKIHENFKFFLQTSVAAKILPALRQLISEHRVTKELLESICYQSPIVPEGREKTMAMALWMGFEYDFSSAIHLLCPQFENIVRISLKDVGAHTSNLDNNGIEQENGLSTLMELPEATEFFGKDLCFEIKALFSNTLGSNLRNEVAHGLLSDETANSFDSIYAWWFVLRIIVNSNVR